MLKGTCVGFVYLRFGPEALSAVGGTLDLMTTHTNLAIDYIEFTVSDVAAAQAFYAAAFRWRFNDYGPDYAGIRGDGDRELGGLQRGETVPGGPLVVLYGEDLDAVERAVVQAGGTIVDPQFDFPGGRRFHFADPSGNKLGVWREAPPA